MRRVDGARTRALNHIPIAGEVFHNTRPTESTVRLKDIPASSQAIRGPDPAGVAPPLNIITGR